MPYTYQHPHPAVTVDCVVFGYHDADLEVLVVQRGVAPFKGQWALPGGFVQIDESLEEAARRERREETGRADPYVEQLYTLGAPKRDPRERVISVSYYALVAPGPPLASSVHLPAKFTLSELQRLYETVLMSA